MSIQQITTDLTGEIGVNPRIVRIYSTNTYEEVTAENYLKSAIAMGYTFFPSDIFAITYGTNVSKLFTAEISNGNITLVPIAGNVTTDVTTGHFAIFDGVAGNLKDGGFSPSNAAKTKVAMADGATVANNFASFADVNGTVKDAGARIISGTTSAFAGGGTSNAFTVTGLTVNAKGSAVIRASTNAVAIAKALPGTNTLTITFSADPGAGTTVDYIYTTASMV